MGQNSQNHRQTSRLVPWIISAGGVLLLLGLGIWQVQRLVTKESLIAKVSARMQEAPEPLMMLLNDASRGEIEYRAVTATGQWEHAKTFFVGPRSYLSANGYHVLTPLRMQDGQVVLVNRGWIPSDDKEGWIAGQPVDAGEVSITGIVRVPRKIGWFVPENSPEKNHWFWEDVAAMEQYYGAPLLPVVVYSMTKPEGRYPVPMESRPNFRNDHLEYALTWFALAIGVGVIFVLWLRKQKLDEKGEAGR